MFFLQSFYIENIKKSIVYNENNQLIALSNKSQSKILISKLDNLLLKNNNFFLFLCNYTYLQKKLFILCIKYVFFYPCIYMVFLIDFV